MVSRQEVSDRKVQYTAFSTAHPFSIVHDYAPEGLRENLELRRFSLTGCVESKGRVSDWSIEVLKRSRHALNERVKGKRTRMLD